MYGFVYSEEWTLAVRKIAHDETSIAAVFAPNGKKLGAQHVWTTVQVFINPAVAALPQHAHVLAGPGCFKESTKGFQIVNRECDGETESKLPVEFLPLVLTEQQDRDWEDLVKKNIDVARADGDKVSER
jgi:hypothetical protein